MYKMAKETTDHLPVSSLCVCDKMPQNHDKDEYF